MVVVLVLLILKKGQKWNRTKKWKPIWAHIAEQRNQDTREIQKHYAPTQSKGYIKLKMVRHH